MSDWDPDRPDVRIVDSLEEMDDFEVGEDGLDHGVLHAPNADPAADSVVDEFVDYFNARDLEGLGTLLSEDVDAELVHASGVVGALEGIEDLFIREPSVIVTRAEIENEPIAAVWHPAEGRYVGFGYLVFDFTDGEDPLIARIEYVEEVDGDVIVEAPDGSELDEWEVEADAWETRGGEHL